MVTPAVLVESVADMFDAVAQPTLFSVTFRLLHSLKSITPFPLPPEIALGPKARMAAPVKQVLKVAEPPSVITTVTGLEGPQFRLGAVAVTVYVPGGRVIE